MTFRQQQRTISACFVGTLLALAAEAQAQSGEPLKIGYGIAQTGGIAANGRSALLAHKIWEEDINAKGGLRSKKSGRMGGRLGSWITRTLPAFALG